MNSQNATQPALQNETRLSINQAARLLDKSPSTIWRWCISGVRCGIKLENFSLGVARYTTREALDRFSNRCTAAANGETSPPQARTPHQRQRDADLVDEQLTAEGF